MPRLADFAALTFDCYGTLIDWERGLVAALEPLARRAGRPVGEDVLDSFSRHEHAEEARAPSALYPDILARVHAAIARDWGVPADPAESARFAATVGTWPPFPDTPDALRYLRRHFRLVILSNVDRASFARTSRQLGIEFDAVYTAEDIGSYKPDARNFDYLIENVERDLGIAKDGILHTAESLYHDHVPAKRLGLATAWIHRRADKGGFGATKAVEERPETDFYFKSMAEMAEAHRAEVEGEA